MTTLRLDGKLWISSLEEGSDNAEVEMAEGTVSVELTDVDGDGEVAIHFTLSDEEQSIVSIYTTQLNACVLAVLLQNEALK